MRLVLDTGVVASGLLRSKKGSGPFSVLSGAGRAAASAKLLLDAGDIDGACNRAYYAMHHAARTAYW